MTNWDSPDERYRLYSIFNQLVYVLFGIYCWEILNTMHVERALFLRIRQFQWPQILYFLCRYTLLLGLIGLLISLSVVTPIDCQALFVFIQWAGNTTIGTSTSLLLVRTIAVWNRSPYVIAPMLLLAAGHWGLLYYGITSVKAEWSPESGECIVTGASPAVLKALYMYTMGFDLVILVMTISGLWCMVPGGRGGLWKLLFADGVAYFTLVASVNAVPAVLNVLDLNAAMNIIATVPACVVSTIAATRLFRRLQDYTSKDVYVHTSFMAGIPSAVAVGSTRRWSTTHGKTPFTLSGQQMQITGDNKAATESSSKPNWETATGLMPHFASFAPRDWETHGGGGGGGNTTRHPYASAGGEESFLSVNEKTDKDTEAELPAFVSFASPRMRNDASRPGALFRYGSPRLSKLDVKVEVIEMQESTSPTDSPSSARATSSDSAPRSADDVV